MQEWHIMGVWGHEGMREGLGIALGCSQGLPRSFALWCAYVLTFCHVCNLAPMLPCPHAPVPPCSRAPMMPSSPRALQGKGGQIHEPKRRER